MKYNIQNYYAFIKSEKDFVMNEEYKNLIQIINDYLEGLKELFNNEEKFKNNLVNYLNGINNGWRWKTEQSFSTNALANEQEIFYDLFGVNNEKAFIIELKHVICNNQGIPHDAPAFPYDVLKDCVKIELLIRKSIDESNKFKNISGASIGLTNFIRYWDENYETTGWASNYIRKIKPQDISNANGILRTNTTEANEFARIYTNKRCHISLGLNWNGEWRNTEVENYRYLILTTFDKNPEYQHDPESSDTIPFINPEARLNYLNIRALGYIPHLAE